MRIGKEVQFDLSKNTEINTYNSEEYDRLPIDSTIYRFCHGKITPLEMKRIMFELCVFKVTEMVVHKDTLIQDQHHKT